MAKNIEIIDYREGNIGSIQNMIRRLCGESFIVQELEDGCYD